MRNLSDYLIGRFYISPSKLYSLLRSMFLADSDKGKNSRKGGYDLEVPVPGDWVTIAVIAERGPIRYTKAPVGVEKDEEEGKGKKRWEGKGKKEKIGRRRREGEEGGRSMLRSR
jgi:minichromosome maintenance protein 10